MSETNGRETMKDTTQTTNKLIHSLDYARRLAAGYTARGLTPEQVEAIAQHMFAHDTGVLDAQKVVTGIDNTGAKSKNLFAQFWLTR